jgi:uncharacterized membrane protein YjjP (DUF1212 family)
MGHAGPGSVLPRERPAAGPESFDLIMLAATILFVNGQTTERVIEATERFAAALGLRATLLPRWGELTLRVSDQAGSRYGAVAAAPVGVDMGKVVAVMQLIDQACDGLIAAEAVRPSLEAIGRRPPVSLARFAIMAAAGAVSLGVIFGAAHILSLVLIAFSAGAGACLRRWLAGITHNPFVQPLCAALLAGAVGGVVAHFQLSTLQRLVAVCPCMVLVPGPHLLSGMIDLARARIALGAARVGYASLVIVMISTGLLLGLALGGTTLPVSEPSQPVPLGYDVIAAGIAVAAYGTFFAMPWRLLPIPILIGMLAHASRWVAIAMAGASAEMGAFVACLLVGVIVTPVADRLRLPFAAFGFASVVSLIPGVFLFRMGGGLADLVALGGTASPQLLLDTIADGATALLIILAMTAGLIVPKMVIGHFYPGAGSERARP